jgi:hypothetical protein
MNDDWITTADAAKLAGYHVERIRELIRENKVVGKKFGPVWAVNQESLMDYLNKMQEAGNKRGRKPRKKFPNN